jgi:hypothetical protein
VAEELLRTAPRCVLAFVGERGPLLSPMAFWSDGAALWMVTSASSVKARRLGARRRGDEARCGVWIPPTDQPGALDDAGVGGEDGGGARGLVISGRARVFSLDDPVGLATHWATLSAAIAALSVKNAASMAGYALDLPWIPTRWLPTNRVVVRLRMERLRPRALPAVGPGIAPALPNVVPPDIRRVLAGQRHVVFAAGNDEDDLYVAPAVWGAGFALDFGDDRLPVAPGTPSVVAVDADPRSRPSQVMGMAVHGRIVGPDPSRPRARGGPRLDAERATWWRGFDVSGAQILARPAGGIVLPD